MNRSSTLPARIQRKFRSPDLLYIGFRKFARAIECCLQLLQRLFPLPVISLGRNRNTGTHPHQCSRKWLRNHQPVPGIQYPGVSHCDVKPDHRHPRRPRQQNRPRLHDISWASRPIEGERDHPAVFEFPSHPQYGPHGEFAARAANLHEPKLHHDPACIFAIEAVAGHHANLEITPQIHRRNHAGMPERVDIWACFQAPGRSLLPRNCEPNRGTNNSYNDIRGPCDQPQLQPLPSRESPWSRCFGPADPTCCCGAHHCQLYRPPLAPP